MYEIEAGKFPRKWRHTQTISRCPPLRANYATKRDRLVSF